MKKGEARNFVRSNIADAFIQGCNHHINNTTNNDYKKFLIDQIAALNKKLKDNGWSTFGVPNYVPTTQTTGGGSRPPTEEEQKIMQQIESSKKILEEMDTIVSDIQVFKEVEWKENLNQISKSIQALNAKNTVLITNKNRDYNNEAGYKTDRKKILDPLANNIIRLVSELKNENTYKAMLVKLAQDITEFRRRVEYLKVSGALGRFPRLAFLNQWYVFLFSGWDNKIKQLNDINTHLTGADITQAKNDVLAQLNKIIAESEDEASTSTNISDLGKFFSGPLDKKGNLDIKKLKQAMATSLQRMNLLHIKMYEIVQLENAKLMINTEFNIFKDLKATIKAVNDFLQTRLS